MRFISKKFTFVTLIRFAVPSILMMILMALYQIVDGIFISRSVGSNALSNGRVSAMISFAGTLVFTVASLLLLPSVLGLNGVWLAVPCAELLTVVLCIYFRCRYFRVDGVYFGA